MATVRAFSNGVHVLSGGAALAGRVVVRLVAQHGFGGDAQKVLVGFPAEGEKMEQLG